MTINYFIRLLNVPLWYYFSAVALLSFLLVTTKKPRISVLTAYLILLFAIAVLNRRPIYSKINLIPFKSYRKGLTKQIIANILAFVPLGFLFRKKYYGLFVSILIELSQLLLHRGYCDIDDLISNAIGLLGGIVISVFARVLIQIRRRRNVLTQ